MWLELNCADKAHNSWLPRQRPLRDRNTNFWLVIYNKSSINHVNLATIGPTDDEITGVTEIVKRINIENK